MYVKVIQVTTVHHYLVIDSPYRIKYCIKVMVMVEVVVVVKVEVLVVGSVLASQASTHLL